MFSVNTYILWNEVSRDAAIIDPGMTGQEEIDLLDNFILSNGLNITHIINTHLHLDHTFGDDYAKNKYGCPIEGHPAENILGENRAAQARMFGIPMELTPLTVDIPLNEGDTITIGTDTIKILHVPGHSPGSIVLHAQESGFIVSGDVLFRSSIGRTDLTQGNYAQLIFGINTKLLTLPADTVVYPGHGPFTTIGNEINNNPYL